MVSFEVGWGMWLSLWKVIGYVYLFKWDETVPFPSRRKYFCFKESRFSKIAFTNQGLDIAA